MNLVHTKSNSEVEPHLYVDNSDNDMAMILFQPDRPVVEGELNYQQQAAEKNLRRLVKTVIGGGTLLGIINPVATGVDNEIRLHDVGKPFYAAIDGIVKTVYAYDSPSVSVSEIGGNRVTLPNWTTNAREDLVYLEIWFEEVMAIGGEGTADTTVYLNGMTHGFTAPNNIKINSIPELTETARRVQLRGKIKSKEGVNLIGTEAKTDSSEFYTDVGNYFLAGSGTDESAQNLNTVDGYVYALPLVKVVRGSNANTMTSVALIAPRTATLQELANATLKDFTTFSTQLSDLNQATAVNKNGLDTATASIANLLNANASLTRENQTLRTNINDIQKKVNSKYYSQVITTDASFATLALQGRTNNNYTGIGSSDVGQKFFTAPANHRLVVRKVYAGLPADTFQFRLLITKISPTIQKSWTWPAKLSNGGSWFQNGAAMLQRDGLDQAIEVPEFDGTVDKYMVITLSYVNTINYNWSNIYTGALHSFGEVHIDFVPL